MKPLRVDAPSKLLDYLLDRLSPLKRTQVKALLEHGSVRVNGDVVTLHRHELKRGDVVDFLSEGDAAAERMKTRLKWQIVHEDDAVVVVDKPAGLLTTATDREREHTLYFELTAYLRAKSGKRAFIVHRLDRDTSGLLLFAKDPESKEYLEENWEKTEKRYAAVAEGAPEEAEGTIESWLMEDAFKRVYSAAARERGAKWSATRYRVHETNGKYSLLELALETGRKNQIRVHLSDLGCPIAGDHKYGAETDPIGRMALHATRLSFTHPSTRRRLEFDSPPPKEFFEIFEAPRRR